MFILATYRPLSLNYRSGAKKLASIKPSSKERFLFGLRLFIKYPLHRRAYRLIRAMDATHPATRTALSLL